MIAVVNQIASRRREARSEIGLIERQSTGRAACYVMEATGNRPAVDRRFVEVDRRVALRGNSVSSRGGMAWTGGAVKGGMVTAAVKLTRRQSAARMSSVAAPQARVV